ncbi:hypothetical protein BDZ89DRAFT_1128671 [Hymenopellis radicata]|nr:hypothetical protein BDZ89DRAFT_1128671 [Hymenopellis radicata]
MAENHLLDIVITIPSSKLDEFLEAFRPAYDGVIAEKENTLFELSIREDKEAGEVVIHLVEAWTCTLEWFMGVQVKKEYYKAYFAITEPMFTKERQANVWKRVERFSHSKPSHYTA